MLNFSGVALVSLDHVTAHLCGDDGVLIASPLPLICRVVPRMEHLGLAVIRAYDLGLSAGVWLGARGHGGRVGPSDTPYLRALFPIINPLLPTKGNYFSKQSRSPKETRGLA